MDDSGPVARSMQGETVAETIKQERGDLRLFRAHDDRKVVRAKGTRLETRHVGLHDPQTVLDFSPCLFGLDPSAQHGVSCAGDTAFVKQGKAARLGRRVYHLVGHESAKDAWYDGHGRGSVVRQWDMGRGRVFLFFIARPVGLV